MEHPSPFLKLSLNVPEYLDFALYSLGLNHVKQEKKAISVLIPYILFL